MSVILWHSSKLGFDRCISFPSFKLCEAKVLHIVAFTFPTCRINIFEMHLLLKRSNSFCWSWHCQSAKVNFQFFLCHIRDRFFLLFQKKNRANLKYWAMRYKVYILFWLFRACQKLCFILGSHLILVLCFLSYLLLTWCTVVIPIVLKEIKYTKHASNPWKELC